MVMQHASTGCEYSVAQEASGQSPIQTVDNPDGVKMRVEPSLPVGSLEYHSEFAAALVM